MNVHVGFMLHTPISLCLNKSTRLVQLSFPHFLFVRKALFERSIIEMFETGNFLVQQKFKKCPPFACTAFSYHSNVKSFPLKLKEATYFLLFSWKIHHHFLTENGAICKLEYGEYKCSLSYFAGNSKYIYNLLNSDRTNLAYL